MLVSDELAVDAEEVGEVGALDVSAPPELRTLDVGVEPTSDVGPPLGLAVPDVVLVSDAKVVSDVEVLPDVALGPVVEVVPDAEDTGAGEHTGHREDTSADDAAEHQSRGRRKTERSAVIAVWGRNGIGFRYRYRWG